MFLPEAAEFKDPEPAISEMSGQTFSGVVNRHHVSEANLAGRNVANSRRRDVFESPLFLTSTSQLALKE